MGVFITSSCASSQNGKQKNDQAEDMEIVPTSSIPFSSLESVLIQADDLPDGYAAGGTSTDVPTYYEKLFIPDADYVMRQQIQKGSGSAGQVVVFYYINQWTTDFAFGSIADDMKETRDLEGVGEKAVLETPSSDQASSQEYVGILFVQCHAVIHLSLLGTSDEQAVIAYAERLAGRLDMFVCD
jgi:hypothetical protein